MHWAAVPAPAARRPIADGARRFALWPSPVEPDVCFQAAGSTHFGDNDALWDNEAQAVLSRLLAALEEFGAPELRSTAILGARSRRWSPVGRRPPLPLAAQVLHPIHWDSAPECVIAFGAEGTVLRAGNGHFLFWVELPEALAGKFGSVAVAAAGPHPLYETHLEWLHLG